MVHIQVAQLVWDYRMLFNPHAFVIYLKLVPALEIRFERFDECLCKDDDIHLFCRT
jgi:hypothetical protein